MEKIFLFFIVVLFLFLSCVSGPTDAGEKAEKEIDRLMDTYISALQKEDTDVVLKTFWPDAVKIYREVDKEEKLLNGIKEITEDLNKAVQSVDYSVFRFINTEKDFTTNKDLPAYVYIVELPKFHINNTFYFEKRAGAWGIIKHILDIVPKTG